VILGGGRTLLWPRARSPGTSGHDTVATIAGSCAARHRGWSGHDGGGSTPHALRVGRGGQPPAVQGSVGICFVMGLRRGAAGVLSGLVVAWSSYSTLTVLAAVGPPPPPRRCVGWHGHAPERGFE